MPNPKINLREVRRLSEGRWRPVETDRLTVEEPLEIRVKGEPLAVIMRTPGDDAALAAGFMVTEALVGRPDEIDRIEIVTEGENGKKGNVVNVRLAGDAGLAEEVQSRRFYTSSSCGICGKASIEAVTLNARPVSGRWDVPADLVLDLPNRLRAAQSVFDETGSLHAAGLFDLEGNLVDLAEDVGRHNALDKVIGRAVLAGRLPLDRTILMASGRISFEIAQKALMAGIPMIGAVSGASSLAVDLAEDQGMTLAGFIRGGSMTVYHGAWRIKDG